MPVLILVIAGVAALAHTAPFPFLLELFNRSLWRVAPEANASPTIYLTFDDGPNPDWTPALLDVLREHHVHATFFLIDAHITQESEAVVKRIADEGHAIALHSGDRWLMLHGSDDMAATVEGAAARIREITAHEPCHLFRPHGGWRSASMYAGLRKAGYTLTGWSWRMWDWNWWRGPNVEALAARLAHDASAGSITRARRVGRLDHRDSRRSPRQSACGPPLHDRDSVSSDSASACARLRV
jgi:peptidoglycan/xylan/chitin deacetylase (PgdA/CDA1 family)